MRDIQRHHLRLRRAARVLMLLSLCVAMLGGLAAAFLYHRYSRVVDRRFAHSALFAARPRVRVDGVPLHPGRPRLTPVENSRRVTRSVPAYDALPPELVQAVVAIEDRRFFQHGGVDVLRSTRCAVQDVVTLQAACGGSTLTQQLARMDFLTGDRTVKRKLAEIVIARRLEDRLTKQQIFAMYARRIDLGQNGPEAIHGFAQAARIFFGKDLRELDLAECALLAGIVHAPNFDNPLRHPERALRRRNVVLNSMVETGAITQAEADAAKAEPLHLAGMPAPDPRTELLDAAQG